jgi:VWFA-related protein
MKCAVIAGLGTSFAIGVSAAAITATTDQQPGASRFVLASVVDTQGQPVLGLTADDFVVEEGGRRCDTLTASPAQYPVAIIVDTTHAARPEFIRISAAVRQFVDRLRGREIALYTFGERATRVADYTRDTAALHKAADGLFARPDAESHVLDAIIDAAKDLRKRELAVGLIVVVSAGGNDQSNRTPREVFEPVMASRSIVRVVELRTPRASGRLNNPRFRRTITSDREAEAALGLEELLRGLADRTRGHYTLIYSSSGYSAALDELQRQLAAEVVLEYLAPAVDDAQRALQLGARLPGVTVRGIGLDRAPRER